MCKFIRVIRGPITWIYRNHQKKKFEYMKFYNFFLLIKWKGKNELTRDKMRIKNAEMRVIKWEGLKWWERERERE